MDEVANLESRPHQIKAHRNRGWLEYWYVSSGPLETEDYLDKSTVARAVGEDVDQEEYDDAVQKMTQQARSSGLLRGKSLKAIGNVDPDQTDLETKKKGRRGGVRPGRGEDPPKEKTADQKKAEEKRLFIRQLESTTALVQKEQTAYLVYLPQLVSAGADVVPPQFIKKFQLWEKKLQDSFVKLVGLRVKSDQTSQFGSKSTLVKALDDIKDNVYTEWIKEGGPKQKAMRFLEMQ